MYQIPRYQKLPANVKKRLEEVQKQFPRYTVEQIALIVDSYFNFCDLKMRTEEVCYINFIEFGRFIHRELAIDSACKRYKVVKEKIEKRNEK